MSRTTRTTREKAMNLTFELIDKHGVDHERAILLYKAICFEIDEANNYNAESEKLNNEAAIAADQD